MNIIRNLALIVLALGLSSCALNTTTQVTPAEKSFIQGKKIAENGDLLFEQILMAKNIAMLVTPFYHYEENTNLKIDVTTTDLLYKLSKIENGYCTFEYTRTEKDDVEKGYGRQVCFTDTNNDGKFDKIYSAGKNAYPHSRMSNNTLIVEQVEMLPISYTPLEANSKVGVESGVRLAGEHFFERARLEFVMKSAEGVWEVIANEDIKFNKSAEYPQDISFLGAKLRIHSISKKQVEYEILSGFRKGQIFTLR